MLPVQAAVFRNHLRLYPDTELHPNPIYLFNEFRKPALDLFFIDNPVSKAGVICIAFPEPAVVEDKHIKPYVLGCFRDVEQFFFIKVKICCLPVIDKDRPRRGHILAAYQVRPVSVMVNAG